VERVVQKYACSLDGLAELTKHFNFEQCLDLVELMLEYQGTEGEEKEFWSVIVALFGEMANGKNFFEEQT
jgi:hypothetical protein